MPEGDTIHYAARRIRPVLVDKEIASIETPQPRHRVDRWPERLQGRRVRAVDARGKNLLLRFEGDLVLRSHLRMNGRWRVGPVGRERVGRPWLVLRGSRLEATQWNGPVLELGDDVRRRLGDDVLGGAWDTDAVVARLRAGGRGLPLGEALQRQRVVAGIGNMWMSEALWAARVSPWVRVGDATDEELRAALDHARRLMHASLAGGRPRRCAYGRAGRPCSRCGTAIRSRGQGDANRTAYWCPTCQPGREPPPVPVRVTDERGPGARRS